MGLWYNFGQDDKIVDIGSEGSSSPKNDGIMTKNAVNTVKTIGELCEDLGISPRVVPLVQELHLG